MEKKKCRLDMLLVKKGLVSSREKARAYIMAGKVYSGCECYDKPGTKVDENMKIEIKGEEQPYVSRGGRKLAKAIEVFPISLENKIIVDIGASTGGFTDCALQNGAQKVYAVDVGYGQLAWKLRNDSRVVVLERTNARYLTEAEIPGKADMVICDVSFISVTKIFPAISSFLKKEGDIIILIKPQFEAGPERVGKKGVVRDPKVHKDVITEVLSRAGNEGFKVMGLDYSPIKGPEGNIEFLAWLKYSGETEEWENQNFYQIEQIVGNAQKGTE